MWEHTLIESKGFRRSRRRFWAIPAAAAAHAVLIVAAIVSTYWHVEAVEAPPGKIRYAEAIPIQIGPPPQLGGGSQSHQIKIRKPPVKETQPVAIEQGTADPGEEVGNDGPEGTDPNAPPGEGWTVGIPGGIGTGPIHFGTGFEGPAPDLPRLITTGVEAPVLIRRVEPDYPRAARQMRLQGIVILEAVITKTGDVEQVKTLRADNILFERAATDAVLQWKYKPATVQGRPVKVYFTVTVTFRMR